MGVMSEYQYYEFAAIDRPLSEKQMGEVRALSTRAEITSTSFTNEYHWGDFKGDPGKLIEKYYDAFLYYANWGTLWCMFRFPREGVELEEWKKFEVDEAIGISAKKKLVVVEICINDEAGDYDVPYETTLGSLIAARTALLEGDLGPLYVAWLAAVERGLVDDGEEEPCDAAALAPICGGTSALADFLCVRPELVKAAYGPGGKKGKGKGDDDLAGWVLSRPAKEKDALLTRFLSEPVSVVRSGLMKRFRSASKGTAAKSGGKRRTVKEILALAEGSRGRKADG